MRTARFLAIGSWLALIAASGCSPSASTPGPAPSSTTTRSGPSASPDGIGVAAPASQELLNVSYDPTRELWRDLNEHFVPNYAKETGTKLTINQSHGGSSTQARAVIDGLEADVVTLALWSDADAICKDGLIVEHWLQALPKRSLPYVLAFVFVVRKGNAKGIKDCPDYV